MSLEENAVSEISLTKTQWFTHLTRNPAGYRPRVTFLGSFSDGSRYLEERQGGVRALYLVTDLTAPARASSTHLHADQLGLVATHGSVAISAQVYTDVVTGNITVPTGLPAGTLFQFLVLYWGNVAVTAGTGTYDMQVGDSTASNFNAVLAFKNTESPPAAAMTMIQEVSPASGVHTYKLQAKTSAPTTTVTFANGILVVAQLLTRAPLSGT